MQLIHNVLFCIYVFAILFVVVYALVQFSLMMTIVLGKKTIYKTKYLDTTNLPFVTIQLPIYNEKLVVERLIDNIIKLDYPKEKIEIQILDDSDDGSEFLIQSKVAYYFSMGFDIQHIQRSHRSGFKAGALAYGLKTAKGTFIAIFDADFLPNTDFLLKTLPYFYDDKVAVIQSRWGHLNENYSLLTRIQARQLNVHFVVEQMGRYLGNKFLQFNGTAGIWRKETIDQAGGWQQDTLTEDLDLSIRAQLQSYNIVYLKDLVTNAELPITMSGVKSQQFRWMKGGAENAKKLFFPILKSHIPFTQKLSAILYLFNSAIFILILIIGIFNTFFVHNLKSFHLSYFFSTLPILSTILIFMVYLYSNISIVRDIKFLAKLELAVFFPIVLVTSMGLCLHNSIAVFEGFLGKKSDFIRTPKFNSIGKLGIKNTINFNYTSFTFWLEGIISIIFLYYAYQSFLVCDIRTMMVQLLFGFGFLIIFVLSIHEK